MGRGGHLDEAVHNFIDTVSGLLAELSGKPADTHRADASIDAANLVAGVIVADDRRADAELNGYLDALGHLLDPPLRIDSISLRESALLDGKAEWLRSPSELFTLLADADKRDGRERARAYYDRAMRLAHVTAALDLVPSPTELEAIDHFRTTLLRAMAPKPTAAADVPNAVAPPPAVTTHPARSLEELLAELDALVGLDHVKAEVRRLTSLLHVQQIRAERGLPVIDISHHLVFTGNPGTGKTTVARLLSQIYREVGVVSKGHLVETDRSKLVAGFVGQTALKTSETLNAALGGMLLIDEAYALARGGENDFGREAIDTLVKFMEDHRQDLAVIAAGYTDEMATLIDTNPGLKSRFTRTILFPDYTDEELLAIFVLLGDKNGYTLSDDAAARVQHFIAAEPRTRGFGNARFVRNLFETAVAHQAMRIAPLADPSNEHLTTLTAADIAPVDS